MLSSWLSHDALWAGAGSYVAQHFGHWQMHLVLFGLSLRALRANH